VDSKDKERLLSLYEDRLEKYGYDVKTVGWGSVKDQYSRFDMLLRGVDCNNKDILDLGCGLGDFIGYLKQKKIKNFTYTGIDLSDRFIEKAKEKYQESSCNFFAKNVRGEIASGGRYKIKNTLNEETAIGFTCFMDTVLRASSFENLSKKILLPFDTEETIKKKLIKKNHL